MPLYARELLIYSDLIYTQCHACVHVQGSQYTKNKKIILYVDDVLLLFFLFLFFVFFVEGVQSR